MNEPNSDDFVVVANRLPVDLETPTDGGQPVWRQGVTTDNGNWILDIHGLMITDPLVVEREINQIPGVVSVGLFARRPADVVIVGAEDGATVLP